MRRAATILVLTIAGAGAPAGDVPRRPVAEAVALIEAAGPGGVVTLPAVIYEGNLIVRAPVTIDGSAGAVFDGLGRGTVVEVRADDVTIRACTVRGSGDDVTTEPAGVRATGARVTIEHNVVEDALFGIDLSEAPGAVVRGNRVTGKALDPERRGDGIRLWWSRDALVKGNVVRSARDMVFWYSENLRIEGNRVSDSRYGLHFMYSHDTVLTGNDLSGNSVGVYLMYSNRITLTGNRMHNNRGASGYGMGLKDCDDIVIGGNQLLANRVGVYVDNSPSSVGSFGRFEGNLIAYNEIGVLATPNTHDNVFSGNAFVENEEPAATHGRGRLVRNTFARDGRGNYWSEYAGFDLDRDGVGDLAFEPRSLFSALLAREPNLRVFVHSPAQRAVEFTARALPELRPEPVLVDPSPLASVPELAPGPARAGGGGAGMFALAGALLGFAGVVGLVFGRPAGPSLGAGGARA